MSKEDKLMLDAFWSEENFSVELVKEIISTVLNKQQQQQKSPWEHLKTFIFIYLLKHEQKTFSHVYTSLEVKWKGK